MTFVADWNNNWESTVLFQAILCMLAVCILRSRAFQILPKSQGQIYDKCLVDGVLLYLMWVAV
jgi:hypothetical protein